MGPVFLFGTGRSGSTHLQRLITLNTKVWIWGEHDGFLAPLMDSLVGYENSIALRRWVFDGPSDNTHLRYRMLRGGRDVAWLNQLRLDDLRIALRGLIERLFASVPDGYTGWGFKELRYGPDNDVPVHLLELFPECRMAFVFREPSATIASQLTNWHHGRLTPLLYQKLIKHWINVVTYFVTLKKAQPDHLVMVDLEQLIKRPEHILCRLNFDLRTCDRLNPTNRGKFTASSAAIAAMADCFEDWRTATTTLYQTALALCDD